MPARPLVALFCALLLLGACSSSTEDGDGALIVGVQGEDLGPAAQAVHVVAKVDGAVVNDTTFAVGAASGAGPRLPAEIDLRGAVGARAEIRVEATSSASPAPVLTRLATAALTAGTPRLLRIQLDPRCVSLPPVRGGAPAPGAEPRPGGAPACAEPQTCIAGRCAPSEVPEAQLESYEPGWAAAPPDVCRPANHGPPEVILGTGQTDFAPLADGQTLQMELGPQGGHHVWIAARMKNLTQSKSVTTITSTVVGDPSAVVPPAAFVFTFEPDEGAYCKVWGLRYQLDSGAADLQNAYKRFLGKDLAITVTIKDATGTSASSTRTVHLADKLLCPDGTTTTCN